MRYRHFSLARSIGRLCALLLVLGSSSAMAQTVWHVDDDAGSSGDGLSWAGAFNTLEKAFVQADVGDEIWVAAGTYRPLVRLVPGDMRSATFLVPQAVKLYGGFAGNETTLDQRAGLFRQTILSGDIGTLGDDSDNAYHVVSVIHPSGIPPGITRIDGFTIRDGNADTLSGGNAQGGGVHSFNSATIVANCIVMRNRAIWGGAFHAQPGALRVIQCTVIDNEASANGGAVWGQALNLYVLNSTFARNEAGDKGGAIYLHGISSAQSVRVVGSLFHDNVADVGGAVFMGGGQFAAGAGILQACTFASNEARISGGGLRAVTGTPIKADSRLYNCIVWRNRAPMEAQLHGEHTVEYSAVMGGAAGLGNISANPLFVNHGARNFRLSPGSPCIDAGDNAQLPNDLFDLDGDGDTSELLPIDLARLPRRVDDPATPDTGSGVAPIVDMGAYEYQP